jgi:hypothetical protein
VAPQQDPAVRDAEKWFLDHGLPYFVDDVRATMQARMSRTRVLPVLGAALLLSTAAGVAVGLANRSTSFGIATGSWLLIAVVAAYALVALRMHDIAGWALKRAFASLGLLFPLATRALPMLLLFVTFLFINTEVWQVTSAMNAGVLWTAVLFFGVAATGFLLARLDEELDLFDDDISAETLLDVTADTPLAPTARRLVDEGVDLQADAEVTGLQKFNLVLALLVAQAVQVLLLAVAVFAFFVIFGVVAIDDHVINTWVGDPAPQYDLGQSLVSSELARVSIFLAAFSGLYFTVYAVMDSNYREQFFTHLMREHARVLASLNSYRERRPPPPSPPTFGPRHAGTRGPNVRDYPRDQASRSCSTSAAILSTAPWSSEVTSMLSPLPAPSVMIISAELASTGSPPGVARVTSTSSSPAASEMIAAGRACRPTADPTTTVLVGMVLLLLGG